MAKFGIFNNGKITSNVIFYSRGVPNSNKTFAFIAGQNFNFLKVINNFNKKKYY